MAGRTFVDTNVLLYLLDLGEPGKRAAALEAVRAMDPGEIVLSTQVLQEYYWNATRKLEPPMAPPDAARQVRELARHEVVVVEVPHILAAAHRSSLDRIAFRDALIVEAALSAGCTRLLSEDFQRGRVFNGLRVENPFLP